VTPDPTPPPGAAPDDLPRTVIEPRESEGGGAALPVGQALQEFVIEGLIGEGGFGIVYLARDTQLGRVVALKEYMPTNLAQRGGDRSVTVRSERTARPSRSVCAVSSTKPSCSRRSTIRRSSRCTGSGRRTAPPTW
jgi:serine/threonine protein kinase